MQVMGCLVTVARAIRVMVVQVTECLVTVVPAIRVWAVRAMVVRVHGLIQGRDREDQEQYRQSRGQHPIRGRARQVPAAHPQRLQRRRKQPLQPPGQEGQEPYRLLRHREEGLSDRRLECSGREHRGHHTDRECRGEALMLITEVPMATATTGGLMDADLWCRGVREHRRLRAPHQLRVRMRRLPWIDLQRQPPGEEKQHRQHRADMHRRLRVRMRRLRWMYLQRQPPGEERRQDLTKWGWPTPTEVPTAAIG